jgi:hypothetical protein
LLGVNGRAVGEQSGARRVEHCIIGAVASIVCKPIIKQ